MGLEGISRYSSPFPLIQKNKEQKIAATYCDSIGKPCNLAELTKERLRRTATKIKDENPLLAGDLGFRVFKLDSSNIRPWDLNRENFKQRLLDNVEHIGKTAVVFRDSAFADDVAKINLTEILRQYGIKDVRSL